MHEDSPQPSPETMYNAVLYAAYKKSINGWSPQDTDNAVNHAWAHTYQSTYDRSIQVFDSDVASRIATREADEEAQAYRNWLDDGVMLPLCMTLSTEQFIQSHNVDLLGGMEPEQ